MDNIVIAVNAVVPFLCYISFGYLVRELHIVDEAFLTRLNQMVFKVFFPILMFYNLYHKEDDLQLDGMLILVGIVSLLLLILVLILVVPRIIPGNPQRGVIIQAIYRSNFVLFALPLTVNVFGESAAAVASMMVAIIVPLYNIFAILILEYFRGGRIPFPTLIKRVLSNPMIMGAIAGGVFLVLGIRLPQCIETPIAQFSNLTTPLALFILGGTLHFSSMLRHAKYLLPTLFVKLIVLPAIILSITVVLHFEPLSRFVLFSMFATPVAAASYSMASNMGGDSALAGELVVASTAFSVITLFFWILFMRTVGLI
ncbi:MAG: AEC family transporter [Butyricicoccus sp.]